MQEIEIESIVLRTKFSNETIDTIVMKLMDVISYDFVSLDSRMLCKLIKTQNLFGDINIFEHKITLFERNT